MKTEYPESKIRFTECCVQRKGVKYLRPSLYRAATPGFAYFVINGIIMKSRENKVDFIISLTESRTTFMES